MPTGEPPRPGRRRWLSIVGGGLAGAAFAGCLDNGGVSYESGTVPSVNGSNRTAEQQIAAATSALTSTADGVSPLDSLSIADHVFVYESGYLGSTVQGTVTNTGNSRIERAEVRVRVFDGDDAQLGQYMARTGDLDGGDDWSFTVVVLENPSSLDRYEIAALGVPG